MLFAAGGSARLGVDSAQQIIAKWPTRDFPPRNASLAGGGACPGDDEVWVNYSHRSPRQPSNDAYSIKLRSRSRTKGSISRPCIAARSFAWDIISHRGSPSQCRLIWLIQHQESVRRTRPTVTNDRATPYWKMIRQLKPRLSVEVPNLQPSSTAHDFDPVTGLELMPARHPQSPVHGFHNLFRHSGRRGWLPPLEHARRISGGVINQIKDKKIGTGGFFLEKNFSLGRSAPPSRKISRPTRHYWQLYDEALKIVT